MKLFFATTLCSFFSLTVLAQDDVNLKEMVGFACYYEGRSTETVEKVTKLLKKEKYDHLSKLLNSANTGEKYLAVIALQRLSDIGRYQLSDREKI